MTNKIINQFLINGKKTVCEKIWIQNVKLFQKSFTKNYKKFINRSIINVAPLVKVKQLQQKRKRSQTKEFPYITTYKTRIALALKFFLTKNQKAKTKTYKRIFTELLNASKNNGSFITKKKTLYEYAFLKKKYFYYRWF